MPQLADLQDQFAGALLDARLDTPAEVISPDGSAAGKRFNVYRNNVAVSLTESLAATYPAVHRLVGDEFFRGAAGIYLRREPPQSPVMLDYGAGFAAFLDGFAPAQSVRYLGDVARLEWAWNRSYYAADAPMLDPSALAAVGQGRLGAVRFEMHPAARLVRSAYPIVSLFTANRDGAVTETIRLPDHGEDGLVVRPRFDVEVMALPEGGGVFAEMLAAGRPLADAAAAAQEAHSFFDLSTNLANLLRAGAFTALNDDEAADI